jgi:hypothetical protein
MPVIRCGLSDKLILLSAINLRNGEGQAAIMFKNGVLQLVISIA